MYNYLVAMTRKDITDLAQANASMLTRTRARPTTSPWLDFLSLNAYYWLNKIHFMPFFSLWFLFLPSAEIDHPRAPHQRPLNPRPSPPRQ